MNDDVYDPPPADEPYEPEEAYDPGVPDPVSEHPAVPDESEDSGTGAEHSGGAPVSAALGVADLRASVADLAEQLTQMNAVLGVAAQGWEVQADMLRAGLEGLMARVAELEPPPEEKADEPEPQAWVDYATAQDWQELAEWTDWLIRTYDVQVSQMVLECWPAHRGVAEELAALRTAWRGAAIAGQGKKPTEAMIYWHDRWLHPTLIRVRGEFQQKACIDRHKPPYTGEPTDPELLDAAKAGAVGSAQ